MTTVLIVLLSLFLLATVAEPLFVTRLNEPLPDLRDPVMVDLEEERDALLRAIHELDSRGDLSEERRSQLRLRYEAKAAQVLRQIDERSSDPSAATEQPASHAPGKRVPWGGVILALSFLGVAAGLGGWVLPRTGQATVTSFFQADLDTARQLQALQQAADNEPNALNLLALADFYWETGDAEGAFDTYQRAATELSEPPALALKRLALLQVSGDPELALELLEHSAAADPGDPETLFYLAELQLLFGDYRAARDTWQQYAQLEVTVDDERAALRIALLDEVVPLVESLGDEPDADTLAALGDAWWRYGEQELAVDAYFQILTQLDPLHTEALSRTGQVLFTSGRVEEAVLFLSRAVGDGADEPDALLFLGNGQYSLGEYEAAIRAWESYIEVVGEDAAGRVPGLIEDAEARLAGEEPATDPAEVVQQAPEAETMPVSAETLYAQNCASCHGSEARGGTGPALAGNSRVSDAAMVENTIRLGRGSMPASMAQLSGDEISLLVDYVTVELAPR